MKPRTLIYFLRAFLSAAGLSALLPLHAEEARKVITSTEIDLGNRSVIYQRVEPPKVTEAVPAPVTAVPASAAPTALAAQRLLPATLSVSCTVYDSGVTSLRWWHDGVEYGALSSLDFNHLRALGSFEADGISYTLFLSIGNAMSAEMKTRLQAEGAKLPASATEPTPALPAEMLADIAKNGGSRFMIVSAPEKADAAAWEGIAALHRYYDAHKDALIAAAQQGEAERLAQEQWLKEHPPVPQDTVIQFWPKKGSRYLGTAATAAESITSGKEGK